MSKWIAEFDLEDGDTMPEHMDLNYNGVRVDFHCRLANEVEAKDCISRADVLSHIYAWRNDELVRMTNPMYYLEKRIKSLPPVYPKSDIDEDIYKASLNLQATAINDLWNTNKQLKKQLEMLKLDRECDKPSGKWISVNERLPEENKWVLCWYKYFRYGDYECMQETYGVGFYDSYGHWGGDVSGHKSEAIAWMPLPEPYVVEEQQGDQE